MTRFDIGLSVGSVILSGVGMAYVAYIVKTSGRDRPRDPEAVQKFIDSVTGWQEDPRYRHVLHESQDSSPQCGGSKIDGTQTKGNPGS